MLLLFYLGLIWPLNGQPYLLRIVSESLPTWIVGNTINNIMLRDGQFNNPSIIIGITTTFAYNILLILVLIILGKFKKNLWILHK